MHLTVYTYLYLLLTFSWTLNFFHDIFYRLISSINNACLILNSILLLICKNERQTIYHVHQSNIFFLYPTMTIKRQSEVIPCSGQDFQDSLQCAFTVCVVTAPFSFEGRRWMNETGRTCDQRNKNMTIKWKLATM